MKVGSQKWKDLITNGAKIMEIDINREKTDQFAIHAAELIKWNKKVNLTAITDPFEVVVKHYLDSIYPAHLVPSNASMLDIGSGGGFPGIPLKILIPSLSVTLIDATRKKVSFLKHVIRTLELQNINARHIRGEDLADESNDGGTFDVIISRAFGSLNDFLIESLPLLSGNGILLAMKGKEIDEEVKTINSTFSKYRLSLTLEKYTLPYLGSKRSIIVIKALN